MNFKGKGWIREKKALLNWRCGTASIDTGIVWNNSGIWGNGEGEGGIFSIFIQTYKGGTPWFIFTSKMIPGFILLD